MAAAEGKRGMLWDLQSSLMSLIANVNIPKGKKKTTPLDFNPLAKQQRPKAKPKKTTMLELATAAGLPPAKVAELERKLAEKAKRK